ncbi:MAG: hypothetical protein ACRCVU_02945 [Flavobacterium sp.]
MNKQFRLATDEIINNFIATANTLPLLTLDNNIEWSLYILNLQITFKRE